MRSINLVKRIKRYGSVGIIATIAHLLLQLFFSQYLPLWSSNSLGFIVGSIVSYYGHAFYTFKEETSGTRFARRWLFLQFIVNIIASALLPLIFETLSKSLFFKFILVLIPALLNLLVWSSAAKFSLQRKFQDN